MWAQSVTFLAVVAVAPAASKQRGVLTKQKRKAGRS
jgi:hypothetical protein